jgi:hypothetical protein
MVFFQTLKRSIDRYVIKTPIVSGRSKKKINEKKPASCPPNGWVAVKLRLIILSAQSVISLAVFGVYN